VDIAAMATASAPDGWTKEDRQLANALRALFPAPAGLGAAASAHWEDALSEMLHTRVPELREAGITASMAITVARIIASHGHRSGVPATLTGLASGQGMLSAARAAQFFAAPVSVIAGVAAVAGALGAGAAQTAWDRAVEDIYLERLSAHPEHPSTRLLSEIKRSDDRAGFAASAASAFRSDARQYVNLDGLGFQSSVLALANHLVPLLGPQDEASIDSLACNREAQKFIATAPVEAFKTTLQSRSYEPVRFDVDGTPLQISRAHVGSKFRDRGFLRTLVRPASLGRMASSPAALAFQYATSATKSVRALVNDIMLQVFDPNTSAVVSRAASANSAASPGANAT
jgi:hypothetical protein